MSNIVRVPFYGDDIEAVQDGPDVWVSVRRMCNNVGLGYGSQTQKLEGRAWATVTTIVTVAEDGKSREMLMLHLDSVPMWLATIEPSRVREDIRPKLIAYQKECARVLRDHFFGRQQTVDIHSIVEEVGKAIVPAVAEALATVMRAERETAIQERTTIGRSGAATINRTLRAIARLVGGDDKAAYRSALSAAHMDLRSALQFSGTGRGWSNLPLSKWPDARAELERMSRTATRTAKTRQLDLPN